MATKNYQTSPVPLLRIISILRIIFFRLRKNIRAIRAISGYKKTPLTVLLPHLKHPFKGKLLGSNGD
jgi:hypothetical protein